MSEVQKTKQEKKAVPIAVGRGLGGVLVLGGALAVAALVAAITNRRKRRRPTHNKIIKNPPSEKTTDGVHGLPSLLESPSPSANNHVCEEEASIIHSKMIGSCESVAIKSQNLEKKYSSQINVEAGPPKWMNGKMDLDNSVRKDLSAADCYDITNKEDFTMDKTLVAAFKETVDKEEKNPLMQFLTSNNKNKEEGEDGTGDSSIESNAKAIWRADTMEGSLETEIKTTHIKNAGKTMEKEPGKDVHMEEVVNPGPTEMIEMQKVHSHVNSRAFLLISAMVGLLLLFLSYLIARSYWSSDSWPVTPFEGL